jgi:CheY-like chemotaxis protein
MFGDGYNRNGHGQALLVVEDEPGTRELLRSTLARAGYSVSAVGSSPEARLMMLAEGFPCVLVTDYQMPGGDGLELARWMVGQQPGTAVVIVTGQPERAMEDGNFHPAFICWDKEWDVGSLPSLVERLVGPAVL